MEYFLLGNCPRILVIDEVSGDCFDLNQIFEDEYSPKSVSRHFVVDGVEFSIDDVFLKASGDTQHQVCFCAHNRVVRTIPLIGKIPHLASPLKLEDGSCSTYIGFVKGRFLDERVDAQRTGFHIDQEDALELEGGPKWEYIVSAAIKCISDVLVPLTEEAKHRALARITSYVEEQAPRYRPLLKHRRDEIAAIPDNITDINLDLELYRIYSEWSREIRRRASESLEEVAKGSTDFKEFSDRFRETVGALHEAAKSELAEYVLHRAAVLKFFETLLGKQEDGRFAREDAVHQLIFPQRKTSNDVDYDEHNLWILDERLAYHQYLASDIPFRHQSGPVDVDSDERPDLLIYQVYNRPIAFVPGNDSVSSIVIVEFKRPERDDYDEFKDPVRQVLGYVSQLREGRAKRADGSTIEPLAHVPCYCYIVATLTNRLTKEITEVHDFTPMPDGGGYFRYHAKLKAYIEVLSYRKVLEDAKKRNRVFFDKLHLKT